MSEFSTLDRAIFDNLKAHRRDELKRIQAAQQEAEEQRVRLEDAKFRTAVELALAAEKASVLLPYLVELCVAYKDSETRRTFRRVRFAIPGHREIQLILLLAFNGEWLTTTANTDYPPWAGALAGGGLEFCDCLADALIAAEIDPNATPVPF